MLQNESYSTARQIDSPFYHNAYLQSCISVLTHLGALLTSIIKSGTDYGQLHSHHSMKSKLFRLIHSKAK